MTVAPPAGLGVVGWKLLRPLGRGAHGAVYLAERVGGGHPLALKLVALDGGAGESRLEQARALFLHGADVSRRLLHPGIVTVHDAGVDGSTGWLAMEFVPGSDLGHALAGSRPSDGLALRVAERLALALAYAHRQGVVHRDLKPANVLVDWASDSVKLADFGLARAGDAQQTGTGLIPGSPAYMAPELLAGSLPTPQSDFYALGVLLFQLLCARLPFEAHSMGALLRQVSQQPPPALLTCRPGLPDELGALLARLLSKRADQRPADGDALATDLRSIRQAFAGPA